MPADHLITDRETGLTAIERAVLAVLAGTPAAQVAAASPPLSQEEVVTAARRYHAAGRAALLCASDRGWHQVNIGLPDPGAAAQTIARYLLPQLQRAHADGTIGAWWYIRKNPYWRLRLSTAPGAPLLPHSISTALDQLIAGRLIFSWSEGVYEPEIRAFGGRLAMDAAHSFFHHDSVNILSCVSGSSTHMTAVPPLFPVRETSLLTCAALLRAAGQDWHEQGDIWHQVAEMRPLDASVTHDRLRQLSGQLHRLLSADLEQMLASEPVLPSLDAVRAWFAAATQAGNVLGNLARDGQLCRGLRDVLAHHIIFHWNRLGLNTAHQAILAHTAAITMLPPSAESGIPRLDRSC